MAQTTSSTKRMDSTTRHHDPLAQKLDTLHAMLTKVDDSILHGDAQVPFLGDVMRLGDELADMIDRVAPEMRERLGEIVTFVRALPKEIETRLARVAPSKEIPSEPLFGALPLARVVPQDIHSLIDYRNAVGGIVTSFVADDLSAKVASAALGSSVLGVSLLTDYRLSAAKVIPIEVHEAIDYVWGAAAIAAPFVFGYWKKEPRVAAVHVLFGVTTIFGSLFTDYRAAEGVGRTSARATPIQGTKPMKPLKAVTTSKIVGVGAPGKKQP